MIKISNVLLSLCLCASVSLSAVSYCYTDSVDTIYAAAELSGECGPNVKYNISDGVLTVSGEGPMYTDMSTTPWDRDGITSVVIESGITLIGNFAFAHMQDLEKVSIPDTVKEIGKGAFMDNKSLKEIVIPDSVTSLGNQCFSLCSSLEKAVIGSGIDTIPSIAFSYCSALKEVDFGENVTIIGQQAFTDCTSLSSVVLKNKVKTINERAFYYCTGLKEITLPSSVSFIGEKAFMFCGVGDPENRPNQYYDFVAYTVKGSYASEYIENLGTELDEEDPPAPVDAYDYYDIVALSLGEGMYYQLCRPEEYQPYGEVKVYYMPEFTSNCGDIVGIMLGENNTTEFHCYAPPIKKNSDYEAETIYKAEEFKKFDKTGYVFATVMATYSDTCMEVSTDKERLFILCDDTKGYERGETVAFVPVEGVSAENMNVYRVKELTDTIFAKGISLGYNSEIDCTLFLGFSNEPSVIPMNNVGYFFVAGLNVPAGQGTCSLHFKKPDQSVAEIPAITLYNATVTEDPTEPDKSKVSEEKTGVLLARLTDEGALIGLDEETSVFILNGIPKEAQAGDVLTFKTLNSVEIGAYYAQDVKIKEEVVYEKGDINLDGVVNIADFIVMKSTMVESEVTEVPGYFDVDGDTYFNIKDLIALKKILMGIE